jgi:hypothetical protein
MKIVSLLSKKFEESEFTEWILACKTCKTDKRFYLNNNISLELFIHIGRFIFPSFIKIKGLVFIEELVCPELINLMSLHALSY